MTRLPPVKIELWLRLVLCLVLANLLFSVGEGLQLRPFTSFPSAYESTAAIALAELNTSPNAHHTNPMETTSLRKSEKRQSSPVEIPPVVANLDSHLRIFECLNTALPRFSSAFYSPTKGRAPPLTL
jgi:hypothetical protein